jgi:hypothetical protein
MRTECCVNTSFFPYEDDVKTIKEGYDSDIQKGFAV